MTKENEVKLRRRTPDEMAIFYADKMAENRETVQALQKRLEVSENKILDASKASTILCGSEYALDPKAIIEGLQDQLRGMQAKYMAEIKEKKSMQKRLEGKEQQISDLRIAKSLGTSAMFNAKQDASDIETELIKTRIKLNKAIEVMKHIWNKYSFSIDDEVGIEDFLKEVEK